MGVSVYYCIVAVVGVVSLLVVLDSADPLIGVWVDCGVGTGAGAVRRTRRRMVRVKYFSHGR